MTIDGVLRAIGALACVYTVALFVSLMSTAALDAATRSGAAVCADAACANLASLEQRHHASPEYSSTVSRLHVAAMFFADTF